MESREHEQDSRAPKQQRRETGSASESRGGERRDTDEADYGEFSFGPHDTEEQQQQRQQGGGREADDATRRTGQTAESRSGRRDDESGRRGAMGGFGPEIGIGSDGISASDPGGLSRGSDRPSFGPASQRGSGRQPGVRPDSADRSDAFRELHALERAAPRGRVQKPYLSRIPDAYETQVSMMQWIESLIVTSGLDATLDALTYYRSLGWITGEVERTLAEHARTIAESTTNGSVDLTMEDHRESLQVIAQLAHSLQLRSRGRPRTRRRR